MENQNKNNLPTISQDDKNAAAISYIWIMSIFIYTAKKENPFIRFHALQAVALFLISLLVFFIPIINQGLELFLGLLMIIGFLKAAEGEYYQLPIIGYLVFSQNPVKTLWIKIIKALQYFFFFLRSLLDNKQEVQEKLHTLKTELLASNTPDENITKADATRNNDIAAFSYLWILSIPIYVMNEKSEYVTFHARQGIVLFVCSILFFMIPGLGIYLNILLLIFAVIGFIMALSGSAYPLPVIGYIAEKNRSLEDAYIHIKAWCKFVGHTFSRSIKTGEKLSYARIEEQVRSEYENKKDIFDAEIHEDKDLAAASYIFLGPIIWWLHQKKPFVVFHARQGTVLLIFFILLYLIEPFRWLSMLIVAVMLIGFLRSLQSEYYYIPFVYDLLTIRINRKEIITGVEKTGQEVLSFTKKLFTPDQTTEPPPPPNKSPKQPAEAPNK
jgi:uncharacterized membrane protein